MTFTDDDLKRLKEVHTNFNTVDEAFSGIEGCAKYYPSKPILSLIARLEAAEELLGTLTYERDGRIFVGLNGNTDVTEETHEWRKAAGK